MRVLIVLLIQAACLIQKNRHRHDHESDSKDGHDEEDEHDHDEEDYSHEDDHYEGEHGDEEPLEKMPHAKVAEVINNHVDKNKDGKTSPEELVSAIMHLRHSVESTEEAKTWDTDNDEKLSEHEVLTALALNEMDDDTAANPEHKKSWIEDKALETAKFKAADVNKDGHLDWTELEYFIHPNLHHAVLEEEVKHHISTKDKNSDGKISLEEYHSMSPPVEEEGSEEHDEYAVYKEEFAAHDTDQDGFLDLEELKGLTSGMTSLQERIDDLMSIADTNKDGHLSIAEFEEHHDNIWSHDALLEIVSHHSEL